MGQLGSSWSWFHSFIHSMKDIGRREEKIRCPKRAGKHKRTGEREKIKWRRWRNILHQLGQYFSKSIPPTVSSLWLISLRIPFDRKKTVWETDMRRPVTRTLTHSLTHSLIHSVSAHKHKSLIQVSVVDAWYALWVNQVFLLLTVINSRTSLETRRDERERKRKYNAHVDGCPLQSP